MVAATLAACSPETRAASTIGNQAQSGLEQVPLTIHSASGDHRFSVEVARTPAQQSTGMMYRHSVPANHGMIFPYNPSQEVAFWMKNTLVPLDMLFIRSDGTIVRIVTAKPLDLTPVPSGEPVAAVLEIRAGRAVELGIREGDLATWPR